MEAIRITLNSEGESVNISKHTKSLSIKERKELIKKYGKTKKK